MPGTATDVLSSASWEKPLKLLRGRMAKYAGTDATILVNEPNEYRDVLAPLAARYNRGDRTKELYDLMMNLAPEALR